MKKKNVIVSVVISLFSSIFAFIGVVSCCGFPLLASILALIGIGGSQIEFFAKYKILFQLIAIGSLMYGTYMIYFRKKLSNSEKEKNIQNANGNQCCSAKPQNKKIPKIILWIGYLAFFLTLFITNSSEVESPKTECCDIKTDTTKVDNRFEETKRINEKISTDKGSCCG